MDILGTNSDLCPSRSDERILAAFTQRLIEIAAVGARGPATSPTTTLKAMRLPAISLDRHGFVIDANAAAEVVFDDNIRIKHRRLFVRDTDSRTLLQEAINQLSSLNAWALELSWCHAWTNYQSSCGFGRLRGRRIRRGKKYVLS